MIWLLTVLGQPQVQCFDLRWLDIIIEMVAQISQDIAVLLESIPPLTLPNELITKFDQILGPSNWPNYLCWILNQYRVNNIIMLRNGEFFLYQKH